MVFTTQHHNNNYTILSLLKSWNTNYHSFLSINTFHPFNHYSEKSQDCHPAYSGEMASQSDANENDRKLCRLSYPLKSSSMVTVQNCPWGHTENKRHPPMVRQYETGLRDSRPHLTQSTLFFHLFLDKKTCLQKNFIGGTAPAVLHKPLLFKQLSKGGWGGTWWSDFKKCRYP